MAEGINFDAVIDAFASAVAAKLRATVQAAGPKINPRLLTVELAGDYLSRSPHSVRHLIKDGRLPVVKIDNRIFLDIKDLDRIIDRSKQVAI